ncbi:hypothetical protein [Pectobacterium polaris]|uniref:hypothetical protein n=1 Tax=Pectobacterium polaris TaxID=2042057 RepID=UPI0032EB1019
MSTEQGRADFEYQAGEALCLPVSIIEMARKGDGYDHAYDSMNIMQPLNSWWHWWKKGRESMVKQEKRPKLIGWRTTDYTDETTDPAMAKNWAAAVGVIPIFEGDINTKITQKPE